MRQSLPRPTDKSVRASKKERREENQATSEAKETDPLLRDSSSSSFFASGAAGTGTNFTETHGGAFRSRRKTTSPQSFNQHFQYQNERGPAESGDNQMYQRKRDTSDGQDSDLEGTNDYAEITFHARQNAGFDDASQQSSHLMSQASSTVSSGHHIVPVPLYERPDTPTTGSMANSDQHPPLLEIPEEVYAVRKSALQVLKPLTRTWVVITVGFSLSVLFGMTRWTRLLKIPYWFILLPSWCSHVGLLWCHVLSVQALSNFIAEANDNRQRPDSRDHLNRTEYLPLLQRSLKFGLKTGLLSFAIFVFEILIYVQLAWGTISLAWTLFPLWLVVVGGILDGIICKTQHILRVICWILVFSSMVLTVMKVDLEYNNIRWRVVVSPIVALLSILSATLIYIVYGHQIGFYQLTESQLTAGNLYSLAALICIVLFVVIGEVIPLSRPVEIETRLFIVVMAPLVVCLVGMGAWVVSRDEFGRLLLYGGQAAVHPMRLRWEANGWTSVQSRGVTIIPMFGEVSYRPLERNQTGDVELCTACACCTCYPYEDEEEVVGGIEDIGSHPYLEPSTSLNTRINQLMK